MATKSTVNGQDVYTTVYQNFAGVDFTNDASNCWYRRSPDALNMLPDDAGNPFKRTGWTIEMTADELKSIIGSADANIEKTAYFEIGGTDYILLFTNKCPVVYNRDGARLLDEFLSPDTDKYGDAIEETSRSWISFEDIQRYPIAERAFFFEGNGECGYYMFVGERIFKLEYYEGENWRSSQGEQSSSIDKVRIVEKNATPPLVLVGTEPDTGGGTPYESINLLSDYRSVTYYCQGNTVVLPSPAKYDEQGDFHYIRVYIATSSGSWKKLTAGTDYVIGRDEEDNHQVITLTNVPEVIVEGEDNVKITYCGDGTTRATRRQESGWRSSKDSTIAQYKVTKVYKKDATLHPKSGEGYKLISTKNEQVCARYVASNITKDVNGNYEFTLRYKRSATRDDWLTLPEKDIGKNFSIYFSKDEARIYPKYTAIDGLPYATVKESSPKYESKYESVNGKSHKMWYKTVTKTYSFETMFKYHRIEYGDTTSLERSANAFSTCNRCAIFGNGIVNQIFFTGSQEENYSSRVWWSSAQNPLCFPDINYTEVGSTDKRAMGFIKTGEYLAVVKHSNGSSIESSVHILYPTSFDENTTYAEKHKVGGVGAVCQYGFNVLNGEPLFVSVEGVKAVDISDDDISVKDRSYYVNGKLTTEALENAYSFVWRNMYFLAIGDRCYVLDGTQKNSWGNDKNNLVYECYYLENVPARCFAKLGDDLYFCDSNGNICRFKNQNEASAYHDSYASNFNDDCDVSVATPGAFELSYDKATILALNTSYMLLTFDGDNWTTPDDSGVKIIQLEDIGVSIDGTPAYNDTITVNVDNSPVHIESSNENIEVTLHNYSSYETTKYEYDGENWIPSNSGVFTAENMEAGDSIEIIRGVPIHARWATIADDDGSVNRFKTMQKKGCVVSLLPSNDSGVDIFYRKDNEDRKFVRTSDANNNYLPTEVYLKKKAKKYKRLQIIVENNTLDDSFGVDQIMKCYAFGNYSKNRGGA